MHSKTDGFVPPTAILNLRTASRGYPTKAARAFSPPPSPSFASLALTGDSQVDMLGSWQKQMSTFPLERAPDQRVRQRQAVVATLTSKECALTWREEVQRESASTRNRSRSSPRAGPCAPDPGCSASTSFTTCPCARERQRRGALNRARARRHARPRTRAMRSAWRCCSGHLEEPRSR